MNNSLINSSFKYCKEIARSHYENFPVASFFIPKEKRNYIYSIYAFARAADDYADEPGIRSKEDRLNLLDEWNQKLINCYNGKLYDPIFIALNKTITDCNIPVEPLENLLKAFKQDVIKNRYENFDEVLAYCVNSANPIGRLMLMIFGYNNERMNRLSDKICTALQLTNFWQDAAVDLEKDRIYLPQDDMKRFGYSEDDLRGKTLNNNFKQLLQFEIEKTQILFDEGKELIEITKTHNDLKKLSQQLVLTWYGGTGILNKIKENNYDIFNNRPKLKFFDKLNLLAKLI
ncbi:MAG: squalene synthase HpnC [Ignavibacteriae bacterium]|nr:MAG: squalene synthase HpnC [Ignavibacteriota bacterium]